MLFVQTGRSAFQPSHTNMKTIIILLASACLAFGAVGDYTMTDDLILLLETPSGEKVVAGYVHDHIKIRAQKVQAASDAYLNAKFANDKKTAIKNANELKAKGCTVPANIKDDTESWIETDANDPEKAKALKDVVPPAEGIGCTITVEAKEKINNAK
jgi:hypothetical protein